MDRVNKVLNFEVKQVGEEESRILRFVGSCEKPDRDNDILLVSGWSLDNFNKSGPILYGHEYDKPRVGVCVNVEKDLVNKNLLFDVYFPKVEELSSNPDFAHEDAKFSDFIYCLAKTCAKLGKSIATSVGFIGIESTARSDDAVKDMPEWMRGRIYSSQELLELSIVEVPCNPLALQELRSMSKITDKEILSFKDKGLINDVQYKSLTTINEKELNQLQNKKVIPYKKYPLADEGEAWDGPAETAAAEVDDLKIMCAWYDEENAENKGAYKLPHHKADKKTVWRGVTAAMGALLGARGGIEIPKDDRKGIYEHLAQHYADFDKEAPEFKDYTEAEIKEMFPEEVKTVTGTETKKADLEGNPSVHDIFEALWNAINPADIYARGGPYIEDLYPIRYPSGNVIIEKMDKYYLYQYEFRDGVATLTSEGVELDEVYVPKSYKQKTGAMLSAKNRETLEAIHNDLHKCHGTMKGCGDKLKEFIEGTIPMTPDDEPTTTTNMTALAADPDETKITDKLSVTVEMSDELKQALDELKGQVSILLEKQETPVIPATDASKDEIDLDAIESPEPAKDPDDIELNIEPGELKTIIQEAVKNQIQGGK
jgi:hypothetical protein